MVCQALFVAQFLGCYSLRTAVVSMSVFDKQLSDILFFIIHSYFLLISQILMTSLFLCQRRTWRQ